MVEPAETACLVVYDIAVDSIRNRCSEVCLDYGLERFQMSAFWGRLPAPRRKELFLRLVEFLGNTPGRILVQPICSEDFEKRLVLHQKGQPVMDSEAGRPRKHRDFPEVGREKPTVWKL